MKEYKKIISSIIDSTSYDVIFRNTTDILIYDQKLMLINDGYFNARIVEITIVV